MAKYMILMSSDFRGEQWLDALNYRFYFFFSDSTLPSNKEISYLKEQYGFKISDKVSIVQASLYGSQRSKGPVKEGWAMTTRGPIGDYTPWPWRALKEKLSETKQSERVYETVLVVEYEGGNTYGNRNAGWNYEHEGYFSLRSSYRVLRRAKSVSPEGRIVDNDDRRDYDYFKIPKEVPVDDAGEYVPLMADAVTIPNDTYAVITYTTAKYNVLRAVSDAGMSLGDSLSKLIYEESLKISDDAMGRLLT